MKQLDYCLVDVFTDRAFGGNQLAVVTDGRGLSTETMQAIAKEFNLSETSFVLPPESAGNDFRVRIFTPAQELPMAGHPTVGTAFVLARKGLVKDAGAGQAKIRFEEGVGPIPVDINFQNGAPGTIWMTQLRPTWGVIYEDRSAVAGALSLATADLRDDLPVQVVSCGVPFVYVPLRSLDAAHRASLRREEWERIASQVGVHEVFLFSAEVEHDGSTVHSRMFAPDLGIGEDPATGAASGPLGCYLVKHGVVPAEATARIVSEQGIEMGRPSFVHIEIDSEAGNITSVRIGGTCHFMGEGHLELDV